MKALTMNNSKLVTVLLAALFFCLGLIVSGLGMAVRGDFLGERQAAAVEARVNKTIDRSLDEINRRLERLEARLE